MSVRREIVRRSSSVISSTAPSSLIEEAADTAGIR
jgi:hypothetical protein